MHTSWMHVSILGTTVGTHDIEINVIATYINEISNMEIAAETAVQVLTCH